MQINLTSHPSWVADFLRDISPHERRIVESRFFLEMASGELPMEIFRFGLVNFYPLIESFPKYMNLCLEKVPNTEQGQVAQDWLVGNIKIEQRHAQWYRDWAIGFGVSERIFEKRINPPPEMDAVNNFLWRVCSYGSLVEAVAGLNYAIEGPTGIWTRRVFPNIKQFENRDGVKLDSKSLLWLRAHADYDEFHPQEAIEIIKLLAKSDDDRENVVFAVKRGMDYYAIAAEACYMLAAAS